MREKDILSIIYHLSISIYDLSIFYSSSIYLLSTLLQKAFNVDKAIQPKENTCVFLGVIRVLRNFRQPPEFDITCLEICPENCLNMPYLM